MSIQVQNLKAFVLNINLKGDKPKTLSFIPGKTKVTDEEYKALSELPAFQRNCADGILQVYVNGVCQPELFKAEKKAKVVPASNPVQGDEDSKPKNRKGKNSKTEDAPEEPAQGEDGDEPQEVEEV